MKLKSSLLGLSGAVCISFLAGGGADSIGGPDDPAARGLDAYVEMLPSAAVGDSFQVNVLTYGYRSAVSPTPLGHVKIEAAWADAQNAPVTVESDDRGTATLKLTMPEGKDAEAKLVLLYRYGDKKRSRTFQIHRQPQNEVELHVPSQEVIPGSELPFWVLAKKSATGAGEANVDLVATLTEGGVVRWSQGLRTDDHGAASARVPIPDSDAFPISWKLAVTTTGLHPADAVALLGAREDVPGKPTLEAHFDRSRVLSGGHAEARIRVRDALGEAIAGVEVKALVIDDQKELGGDAWEKSARRLVTDGTGTILLPVDIPEITFGRSKAVWVRATVDGRDLESSSSLEIDARSAPSIQVVPEERVLVPGVEQKLVVVATDSFNKPIQASFDIAGDGLQARVQTDAHGRAITQWKVPRDVGATRNIGPCSGLVAATVRVTAHDGAPKEVQNAGPVPVCLEVDRGRSALLVPSRLVARAGESLPLVLQSALGAPPAEQPEISLAAAGFTGLATLSWDAAPAADPKAKQAVTAPEHSLAVVLPDLRGGLVNLTAARPANTTTPLGGSRRVIELPRVLPRLTAQVVSGRAAPDGDIEIGVKLEDDQGHPLLGVVSGYSFDKFAAGPEDDTQAGEQNDFDTRARICAEARIRPDECDAALANDPSAQAALLVGLASASSPYTTKVENDPGGNAKKEMEHTFRLVLKNLEGAVFQATRNPARLRDVLRKTAKGNEFNPEIMTLVASVLDPPPITPGGEPFALADLTALDPEVTYDNVARRVTRLKMFRLLEAIRNFRNQNAIDPSEPILGDPNAILRRLFEKEDSLEDSDLRDAWGGGFEFEKSRGAALPFLSPIPGWELHAAGPDGKLGSGDDLSDPFLRVLKSGSPYAEAMGEDRIVDSRLDMRVADSTVSNWSTLLTNFTGTELGTGDGFGSGNGRLSGSHRSKPPSVRMGATSVSRTKAAYVLSEPVRTDASGVARVKIHLGANETTYRVVLLALPDDGGPASTALDVPTSLPVSVRIQAGQQWISGDVVKARVKVTNRTTEDGRFTVHLGADQASEAVSGEALTRQLDVPRHQSRVVLFSVHATHEGQAALHARVEGPGGSSDSIDHLVDVGPAGRHVTLGRARWVQSTVGIDVFQNDARRTMEGAPALILDEDRTDPLLGVLDALAPDRLSSAAAAVDAIETFERLARALDTARPADADRARSRRDQAVGRFVVLSEQRGGEGTPAAALVRRARKFASDEAKPGDAVRSAQVIDALNTLDTPAECPAESTKSLPELLAEAEAEPKANGGGVTSCWQGLAANAVSSIQKKGSVLDLARLILAFADRPHRIDQAQDLAGDLAKAVKLGPSGAITLPGGLAHDRGARALVYAALLRAAAVGWKTEVPNDTLAGWLVVQRAADGGFGGAVSTRAAVQALVGPRLHEGQTRVTIRSFDAGGSELSSQSATVDKGPVRLDLDRRAARVKVEVDHGSGQTSEPHGLLVRLEQRALLGFVTEQTSSEVAGVLSARTRWPSAVTAEATASVELQFDHTAEVRTTLWARIPLPPGVALAEPIEGVHSIEGGLLVSQTLEPGGLNLPVSIPLRFALAGDFTLPEAKAKLASDDSVTFTIPSSRLRVAEKQ